MIRYIVLTAALIAAPVPVLASDDACQWPDFPSRLIRVSGGLPPNWAGAAAAGDIDGDGRADLVFSRNTSSTVILYGLPGGGFAEQINLPQAVTGVRNVLLRDLEGDGDLDLVAAGTGSLNNNSLEIGIWRNEDGTLAAPTIVEVWSPNAPSGFDMSDLDGNGKPDIIVAVDWSPNNYVDGLWIVLAEDDGSFGNYGAFYEVGNTPRDVIARDFDGDGDIDVAVATQQSTKDVAVLLNDGSGALGSPVFLAGTDNAWALAAEDVDGDGDVDIAMAVEKADTGFALLLNDGAGVFTPATVPGVGGSSAIMLADVDGDGDRDAVLAAADCFDCAPFETSVLLNDGAGLFAPPDAYPQADDGVAVLFADFTDDAIPDVAVSSRSRIVLTQGVGDGSFRRSPELDAGVPVNQLIAADFIGDASIDVLGGSLSGAGLLAGNGDGTFDAPTNVAAALTNIAAGDVDGDGDLDVVGVSDSAATVTVNNGNGSFTMYFEVQVYDDAVSVELADITGDSILDTIASDWGASRVRIRAGDGYGNFWDWATHVVPGNVRDVAAADYNGDGAIDVAIGSDDRVDVRFNDGAGGLQAPVSYAINGIYLAPTLTSADLDGDGWIDLVAVDIIWLSNSGGVYVLRNAGGGVFEPPVAYEYDEPLEDGAVGDFDGDGRLDIAANWNEGFVVLNGYGDGTFSVGAAYRTLYQTNSIAAADLDGDGKAEIVTGEGGIRVHSSLACTRGDVTHDGYVGFADLVTLLTAWGDCGYGVCGADVDNDGTVGFMDFVAVLLGWTPG